MDFLKKLGQVALQGLAIASGVAPYVTPILNRLDPAAGLKLMPVVTELQAIAGVVQSIEIAGAVGGLDGPKKLQLAAPLVKQVILASDLLAKHKIADPVRFGVGVDKVTAGVADILSSLNDHVDTIDKA